MMFAKKLFTGKIKISLKIRSFSYLTRKETIYNLQKKSVNYFCNEVIDEDLDDQIYSSLVTKVLPLAKNGHQLLVLQPYIKWGPRKRINTTGELQLEEACALVSTLQNWSVVEQLVVPLERVDKQQIFGKGKIEELKLKVAQNQKISAIFISTKLMTMQQKINLESIFKRPIFDRYSLVIQIFKENANTKHAKLQVALAELPYIKDLLSTEGNTAVSMGMSYDAIKETLHAREAKLRAEMKKCQIYHHTLEKNRLQRKTPLVAVVGYTNAGKTSIIKALTGEKKLKPKDSLFATLDVTMHEGILPSRLKVVYVDTVGFMSDLPQTLLECFVATLDHVAYADAILHVCDGSHPDLTQQREHVLKTLSSLKVPPDFLDRVITVRNKCDRMPADADFDQDLPVSAKNGTGLGFLMKVLEAIIMKTTGRQLMVLRVPSGGEEARWLYKETAVCDVEADPADGQYLRLKVLISDVQVAKFKSYFVSKRNKASK